MANRLGLSLIDYRRRGGVIFSAEYQTWYDSLTTPPSADVAAAQNVFTETLVAAGLWGDQFDAAWLFAQESNGDSEALKNIINPGTYDATLVSAPGFTSLEGIQCATTGAKYINLNLNPGDGGTYKYVDGDASFGLYSRTDVNETRRDMGNERDENRIITRFSGNTIWELNQNGNSDSPASADSLGMYIVTGFDGVNTSTLYKNKAAISTHDFAMVAIADDTFYLGTIGATAGDVTNRQYAFGFVGKHLTSANVTILTDALEVYMDSNGKGVIA